MRFCTDDVLPILGVFVAACHHNGDFFFPCGAQVKDFAVNLDGNRAGIRHDHGFSGQKICAVLLVVRDNILAQRLNGGIRAEHAFHLTEHFLAFLNGCAVGHLLQRVIGRVNQAERVLIEFQMNHAAFVVDRSCRAVLYRLRHIVNVDVIAEHLAGVAVFDGNRRSRKADKGGVRECVMQYPRIADRHAGFFVSVGILGHDHPLVKTVLPAVGFVCHDHNVAAFGQRLLSPLKLEKGGKDNAVCLAPGKQGFQMLLAFRLHGSLTEEAGAFAELRVKLIVKVDAVGHDDNGRAM